MYKKYFLKIHLNFILFADLIFLTQIVAFKIFNLSNFIAYGIWLKYFLLHFIIL